jgi:hypothetical protein
VVSRSTNGAAICFKRGMADAMAPGMNDDGRVWFEVEEIISTT